MKSCEEGLAPPSPAPETSQLLSDYPPDDCACESCRFVALRTMELIQALFDAKVRPFHIGLGIARELGRFIGFHSEEGRRDRVVEGIAAVIACRAELGEIEAAALEAEEAVKQ